MAVTPASAYADSRALRAASTSATHDALIDDLDASPRASYAATTTTP